MKEILDKGVVCNKKAISIDSDKKIFSCKLFMELVCSQITQLPFFNQRPIISDGVVFVPLQKKFL